MRTWQQNTRPAHKVTAEKIGRWDLMDPHIVTVAGEVVSVEPGFWNAGYDRGNSYAVLDTGAIWPVMVPTAAFEAAYTPVGTADKQPSSPPTGEEKDEPDPPRQQG